MPAGCCRQTVEDFFQSQYPLAGPVDSDALARHLLRACRRWGRITSGFANEFNVRTASSRHLGVDAKTGVLPCTESCPNGGRAEYIFIGSRLFYFIWRVNMICGTFWTTTEQAGRVALEPTASNWPGPEQVDQLRIALEMYFGDARLMGVEGLSELNRSIFHLHPLILEHQISVTDLAELFVLFHEIQHRVPASHFGEGLRVRTELRLPDLSPRRTEWWSAELDHDANALLLVMLSAADMFAGKGFAIEDAKNQAASLACVGADAALHALQYLEERRFGKVAPSDAATLRAFAKHPPSGLRRDHLSRVAYTLVTQKASDSLYRREFTPGWRIVAENVASNMNVRDKLFAAYPAEH